MSKYTMKTIDALRVLGGISETNPNVILNGWESAFDAVAVSLPDELKSPFKSMLSCFLFREIAHETPYLWRLRVTQILLDNLERLEKIRTQYASYDSFINVNIVKESTTEDTFTAGLEENRTENVTDDSASAVASTPLATVGDVLTNNVNIPANGSNNTKNQHNATFNTIHSGTDNRKNEVKTTEKGLNGLKVGEAFADFVAHLTPFQEIFNNTFEKCFMQIW